MKIEETSNSLLGLHRLVRDEYKNQVDKIIADLYKDIFNRGGFSWKQEK